MASITLPVDVAGGGGGGGSGITSINGDTTAAQLIVGTTNRLTAVSSGGTTTLNISASYVGQASITTVGTIGTGTWAGTTVAINHGGTGQTTANTAFNALAPSQTSNSGKFLTTNGTDTSWATVSASPGGSNTQVQFNNSGSFGGDSGFTTDGAGNVSLVSIDISALIKLGGSSGTAGQVLTSQTGSPPIWATPAGGGDVLGPGSSTTNAVATYADATGTLLKNNTGLIFDGNILSVTSSASGSSGGQEVLALHAFCDNSPVESGPVLNFYGDGGFFSGGIVGSLAFLSDTTHVNATSLVLSSYLQGFGLSEVLRIVGSGGWNIAQGGVGSSGQYLLCNATAHPTWTTAGADTQVLFNSSGAISGSGNFVYSSSGSGSLQIQNLNNITGANLNIGTTDGSSVSLTTAAQSSIDSGSISIIPGNCSSSGHSGGTLTLQGGPNNGNGPAGDVTLAGGIASGGANGKINLNSAIVVGGTATAPDGTYSVPTSITIKSGIITAIS